MGVAPCQRHPQIQLSAQTSMPKYDPFFEPLLPILTFQEMTIKHLIYMQKVPFYIQKGPVWFFLVLKRTLEDFVYQKSVVCVSGQRERLKEKISIVKGRILEVNSVESGRKTYSN